MKNENAIMDRIKARIAYHANEHRHTYEIGKGVMDFLARDLLADFKAAGGLLPPVALDGDVYVIYRRKPVKAKVIFIGINADRLFSSTCFAEIQRRTSRRTSSPKTT